MLERPDVSVVVIAYDDADRLPVAVRSVLTQSLQSLEVVIVDDASTDTTAEVADQLAARHPRVRAIHLDENSGGCSRPRNVGIERARGRYVMFLDSDDVLDRHACLNLVGAADETDADLVSGLCVRVYLNRVKNRTKAWYPWLYQRRAVHDSVMENPDLFYDTLSTNKCYRRDFLIAHALRFPEGLHYEDLLFSAQAYLAAERITLIPHRVYTWHVEEKAEQRSISNRRAELRNFADRLEIHRRIDAALDARGAADLRLVKDAKFLNHDLLLYLRELRARDGGYRSRFLELAQSYMAGLDQRVFAKANPMPAIAAYLLGRGDLDGALAAAEYDRSKPPELRSDLTVRDGRVFWGRGDHLDDELGRSTLDVTHLGIHSAPLRTLRPAGTLTTAGRRGSAVELAGYVPNPLGRIPADAEMAGRLEFFDRRRRHRLMTVPAKVTRAGDRIDWQATFSPARRLRPLGFADPVWDLRLRLTIGGEHLYSRPCPPGDGAAFPQIVLPVRPRLTRLAGDHLASYVTEWGHVSFRLASSRPWAPAVQTAVLGLARTTAGRRAWARLTGLKGSVRRRLTGQATKLAVYDRVLTKLPIRRGTVVFESHLGAGYSDNPRYIFEELRRRSERGAVRAIWSYAANPKGFPQDAALVRRGSWAYYLALARAEFWVDNQGFPEGVGKRAGTTYLQTWHGSAFKRMGLDQPQLKAAGRAEHQRFRRRVERFDHFLVRSDHDVRTLARGLEIDPAKLLPVGYPRNDDLVNGGDAAELNRLREHLELDGRQVVLYAPTFRTDLDGRPAGRFELPFDPARFAATLGDTHVLLIRPHYLCTITLPPGTRHAVRDVGALPDITPLLLLADVLITDYSSVMFDYALLDRPMIFFAPDEEEYVGHSRGSYFDLAEHAPGPIIDDEAGLLAALTDLDTLRTRDAPRRREFAARFGEHDQGTAARRIVDRFFLAGAGHE